MTKPRALWQKLSNSLETAQLFPPAMSDKLSLVTTVTTNGSHVPCETASTQMCNQPTNNPQLTTACALAGEAAAAALPTSHAEQHAAAAGVDRAVPQ